jgi:hypothetical protein
VERLEPVRPKQPFLDGVGDGLDLAIGCPVTDDEVVGDVAQPAEIDDDEVLRLLVSRGVDDGSEFRGQDRPSSAYSPWARI